MKLSIRSRTRCKGRFLRGLAWFGLGCGLIGAALAQPVQNGGLTGASSAGSRLGASASISADGATAILGAPGFSANAGGAWIFRRSGVGWDGAGTQLTAGTGAAGAGQQGYAVGLSGDGLTAIVGAAFDTAGGANAGAFWIYASSGGTFAQQGTIHSGAAGQQLGYSVALSGDGNTAIIGAFGGNSAVVWTRSGTTWSLQATLAAGGTAGLGASVAVSVDGNTALIGAPDTSGGAGAAWVFTRSVATWSSGTLLPLGTPAVSAGRQGLSVSLAGNGQRALVGGYSAGLTGASYVYTLKNGTWSQEASLATGAGAGSSDGTVALSSDGNAAVVGGSTYNSGAGALWLFNRSVNPTTQAVLWTQTFGSTCAAGYQCGASVAVDRYRNNIMLGAPGTFGTGAGLGLGLSDLSISKTHNGTFTRGAAGSYKISVSNVGSVASAGLATVTDKMPAGLTYTGFSGSGWSCSTATANSVVTVTCTSTNAVATGASYPDLTLNVTVAQNAPPAIGNTATVSGGGQFNTGNDTSTDLVTLPHTADLAIAKTHSGALATGATVTYKIIVQNAGTAPTSGTVTVSDNLPAGLGSPVVTSSTGWSPCSFSGTSLTCSRSDVLAGGSSYSAITYTVTVTGAGTIVNTATVSGGGDGNATNNSSTDTAAISALGPDLTITKRHAGNFTHGQSNDWYLTVSNSGSANTLGQVMVVDAVPAGATLVSMSGTGWICADFLATCVRSDVLAPGASYQPIRVKVRATAAGSLTNNATVSGGGDVNTGNNSASDFTTVN